MRGEVVLVLAGNARADEAEVDDAVLSDALAERLGTGARTREVVDEVAADFGVPKRRVYDLALALKGSSGSRT